MSPSNAHAHAQREYIVTHDVPARIQSLRTLGLQTPDATDKIFQRQEWNLRKKLQEIMPEMKIIHYDMVDLSEKIWGTAMHQSQELKGAMVISTCQEISNPRRGHTLEINRIVNINGDIIGFGPRPGAATLDKQIASLAALANGAPLVIVEDGAFSGSTIKHVLKLFKEKGLTISSVIIGFCFPQVAEEIQNESGVKVVSIEQVNQPIDWMPDHDFYPLVPNCGRILGTTDGRGNATPQYSHEGACYSIPYIKPFGDLSKWGSIPENRTNDFSKFCLEHTLRMFEVLNEMNETNLTFADFAGARPSVCIPIMRNQNTLPSISTPIVEFLEQMIAQV